MTKTIQIDGAQGEGGGQILRSALALSIMTATPFCIEGIRANCAKPGLMRQHLTAVKAATEICRARTNGAEIGSSFLSFSPGAVQGGDYHFAVGTAGSAILVAQTLLPALMLAPEPSRVIIEGGTHNIGAPPFEFFAETYLPLLKQMGAKVQAVLHRPGFFPAGGGRIELEIQPVDHLTPISLMKRGKLQEIKAEAVVANLSRDIAGRELKIVAARLGWPQETLFIREERQASGPGNVLLLKITHELLQETFAGFGKIGVSAENVAKQASKAVSRYLKGHATIGPHLADQLLLPMAMAGQGMYTTLRPSRHVTTNIEVIKRFFPVKISLHEKGEGVWEVAVATIPKNSLSPSTESTHPSSGEKNKC